MSDTGAAAASSRYVRWFVSGRVQGVGFRYHVQLAAREHGVRGEVRNTPDGRVEVRAEGTTRQLEALMESVRGGPPRARVERVEVVEESAADPARGLSGFRIRH